MKISLKKKKLVSGRYSLYLEYYKGYSIDENGKQTHNRNFEYLKLYLHGNPITISEKNENKETWLTMVIVAQGAKNSQDEPPSAD